MLALTKGNKTKLKIKTLENASNGGNKIVNLKQESIKTFLKSSKKYKDTFRGCLSNQSHSTDDGPERAVQGPKVWLMNHHPIGAKITTKSTSEMGHTNEKEKDKNCATNQRKTMGQVTILEDKGQNSASQAYLGRGTRKE